MNRRVLLTFDEHDDGTLSTELTGIVAVYHTDGEHTCCRSWQIRNMRPTHRSRRIY